MLVPKPAIAKAEVALGVPVPFSISMILVSAQGYFSYAANVASWHSSPVGWSVDCSFTPETDKWSATL
jgi:hypothetical protein